MAKIKLPAYLSWRNGRPRWQPGPRLRDAGWKGRDLKDDHGAWLSLADAITAAETINKQIKAGAPQEKPKTPLRLTRTVRALYEVWKASRRFTRLNAQTQADYLNKISFFLEEFGDQPLLAVEKHHLYNWWEEQAELRGHAMANGIIAVARTMLSHAGRIGWRSDNPARALGLDGVAPRVVIWTPTEVAAYVKLADEMELFGLGDAVVIGLHSGQRQGDVLKFAEPTIEGARALFHQSNSDARALIQQNKTGARVAVPFTDQLAERLRTIKRRRAANAVVSLVDTGPLVRRPDGRTYDRFSLGRDFRIVRAKVAAQHPAFAGKTYQDLRDTAVTRLALAGCTVPEIRAITGHSMETVHAVLAHYLALDDAMAKAGIDRLKKWMDEEGIAL